MWYTACSRETPKTKVNILNISKAQVEFSSGFNGMIYMRIVPANCARDQSYYKLYFLFEAQGVRQPLSVGGVLEENVTAQILQFYWTTENNLLILTLFPTMVGTLERHISTPTPMYKLKNNMQPNHLLTNIYVP